MKKAKEDFTFSDEILVSKSDIEEKNTIMSELKTRVEELKMANEYQLRLKDMYAVMSLSFLPSFAFVTSCRCLSKSVTTRRNYNEKIKDLTDKFMQDAGEMKNRIHNLAVDKDREETRHDQEIGELMDRCASP
jgi:hypothetical protein